MLVRALVKRFRYMSQTFAAVLLFIALRLLTRDVVSLSPLVSLAAIAAILFAGPFASAIGDLVAPPHVTELAERPHAEQTPSGRGSSEFSPASGRQHRRSSATSCGGRRTRSQRRQCVRTADRSATAHRNEGTRTYRHVRPS
jgi:hypothetical protein